MKDRKLIFNLYRNQGALIRVEGHEREAWIERESGRDTVFFRYAHAHAFIHTHKDKIIKGV